MTDATKAAEGDVVQFRAQECRLDSADVTQRWVVECPSDGRSVVLSRLGGPEDVFPLESIMDLMRTRDGALPEVGKVVRFQSESCQHPSGVYQRWLVVDLWVERKTATLRPLGRQLMVPPQFMKHMEVVGRWPPTGLDGTDE